MQKVKDINLFVASLLWQIQKSQKNGWSALKLLGVQLVFTQNLSQSAGGVDMPVHLKDGKVEWFLDIQKEIQEPIK
ncbi:MAG: hypothetical protein NTY83_00850, partial [Candidatus Micrarchaeota archaeon]|nr:hypothetical protein [Candidatus Micrarchaeota archaeon]